MDLHPASRSSSAEPPRGRDWLRWFAAGALVVALAPGVALAQSPSPVPASTTQPSVGSPSVSPATWPCSGWKPVPAAEPTPAPSVSPSPPPITPTVLSMAEAWGDVPVQSIRTDLGHGRRFQFAGAATPDGKWLIGSSVPEAFDVEGKVTWGPGDAVLMHVSDGAVRTMARLTLPESQMGFAATDGRWVIWTEEEHGPRVYGARVRLHDRETGKTRDLTREARKAGARLLDATLSGGGHLVVAQAPGSTSGRGEPVDASVRVEDLHTGAVTTLAEDAEHPVATWPWVAWGSTGRSEGDPVLFTVTNIETGQQVRLDMSYPTLVLNDATAVYGTFEHHIVCLIDDLAAGTAARPILADADTYFEWMTVNDRVVAYYQQSLRGGELGKEPTQVYDRQLDALVDLPMVVGYSATYAVGPLVVWMTPTKHWDDPPDFIRVVDTRDIKR